MYSVFRGQANKESPTEDLTKESRKNRRVGGLLQMDSRNHGGWQVMAAGKPVIEPGSSNGTGD